jgi:N-acetylmuramoyl-L-alanine amidase
MPWTDPLRCAAACLIFTSVLAAAAQQTTPPTPPPPAAPTPALPPLPPQNPAQPAYVVVIDAAHGGNDSGAKISPTVQEKDITLSLAIRLRSMLAARGIAVIATRSTDIDLPMATRAGIANHAQAAACLVLHATSSGSGVHLFTSSLAPAPQVAVPSWATAQAGYVSQSLRLSSDIDSALAHASIPVILGRTFLQPIDNLTCPAIAIELAPIQAGNVSSAQPVDDASYQTSVLNAIVAALLQWRDDWRQQP